MMFRLAVAGFAGLLLLPSLAPEEIHADTQPVAAISDDGAPYKDSFSPVALATGLTRELTGLCARQPVICIETAKLADATFVRAEHGLRVAYAMIIAHRDKTSDAVN